MKRFFQLFYVHILLVPIICVLIFCFFIPPLYAQDDISGNEESSDNNKGLRITIDNDYSDWKDIPVLSLFSSSHKPQYFNQEVNGNSEQKEIDNSFYWAHNGTNLKEIKAVVESNIIYFFFSTYSPVVEGLIIFFYLHQSRERNVINLYTLEMTIDKESQGGKMFLWDATREGVIEAGSAAINPRSIECMIDINLLPHALKSIILTHYSCDITTCFYEKSSGMYEEFYFTTIYFKDIPSSEEL